jgi:small subunit ribosomal protein S6
VEQLIVLVPCRGDRRSGESSEDSAGGALEVCVLNQYEGMFLFDPTFASDIEQAKQEVQRVLGRANAEITFLEKWDERKLAYEIKGRKRGCYLLSYFNCEGDQITGIERDVRISEPILRALFRRADGVSREHIERFMPQARASEEGPERSERRVRGRDRDSDSNDAGDESDRPRRRQPSRETVAVGASSEAADQEESTETDKSEAET